MFTGSDHERDGVGSACLWSAVIRCTGINSRTLVYFTGSSVVTTADVVIIIITISDGSTFTFTSTSAFTFGVVDYFIIIIVMIMMIDGEYLGAVDLRGVSMSSYVIVREMVMIMELIGR